MIILLLSGCGGDDNEQQIGRQYLESGQYQSFEQESRKEAENRGGISIETRLGMLTECREMQDLSLPVTLNEEILNSLLSDRAEEERCEALEKSGSNTETEISVAGRLSRDNPEAWLVVIEPYSVYKKKEIVVVTLRNDRLAEVATVALYQQDLSRDLQAELTIERNGGITIRTVSHRKIMYPIEQEATVEDRFIIRENGSIEKTSSSNS